MKAQCAVKETAQTAMTKKVVRRVAPRKRSATAGSFSLAQARNFAACHSSGSGTARRTHNTNSAGKIPIRNRMRGALATCDDNKTLASTASRIPMFTPDWRMAASHGRHFRGHVSERSEEHTSELQSRFGISY